MTNANFRLAHSCPAPRPFRFVPEADILTCGELKYGSVSAFKVTVLSQITPLISNGIADTFRELLITIF